MGIVDPEFRTKDDQGNGPPVPTLRTSRIIVESGVTANGTSIPQGGNQVNQDALRAGLPQGVGAKFTVVLTPAYTGESFWNKFGQEFHLIFEGRTGANSMGIGGIAMEVEAMGDEISQTVQVFERK